MKNTRLVIFFSLLIFLVHTQRVNAQSEWDAVLERYGEICKKCIELREMIGRGESVPSDKISSLLGEMKTLREKLKDTSASMTPRQRKLYKEIKDSYALHFGNEKESENSETGFEPISVCPGPLKSAAIIQDSSAQLPIGMPVQPLHKYRKFHLGVAGIIAFDSEIQYGISLSGRINRWGAYVSATSNFSFTNSSYSCNSSGAIDGGGVFWGDGSTNHTRIAFCLGPTYRVCRLLDVYAGIGYTGKKTFWKDLCNEWAQVTDLCYNSVCAEVGAKFILRGFNITAGAKFDGGSKKVIPNIGLGYEF